MEFVRPSTQVKILGGNNARELEDNINDFIKDKTVIDIRFITPYATNNSGGNKVLVIYEVYITQEAKDIDD